MIYPVTSELVPFERGSRIRNLHASTSLIEISISCTDDNRRPPHGSRRWPLEVEPSDYCFAFLLIAFTGPGAYALDTRRRRGGGTTARGTRGRFSGWSRGLRGFARR